MRTLIAITFILAGSAMIAAHFWAGGSLLPRASIADGDRLETGTLQIWSRDAARNASESWQEHETAAAHPDTAHPPVADARDAAFERVPTHEQPTPVRPADASSQRVLVMALQGELRRVGCYRGSVDGSWHGSSKAAMQRFIERVNARLPVGEPDYALLNLLQSTEQDACLDKEAPVDFITSVKVDPAAAQGRGELRFEPAIKGNPQFAPVAGFEADDLPEPMGVGGLEEERPSSLPARDRVVEDLFKHPLGRF